MPPASPHGRQRAQGRAAADHHLPQRLLALTLRLQGILFEAFEGLLQARIDGAIASGSYDVGLETLQAERFTVEKRQIIHVHEATGAKRLF